MPKVALFTGCMVDYRLPEIGIALAEGNGIQRCGCGGTRRSGMLWLSTTKDRTDRRISRCSLREIRKFSRTMIPL
jgi:hypothetical protein